MNFDVSADAYLRFMGRYSEQPAASFADAAGVRSELRVLDVGCGPGALSAELALRSGTGRVCAVEPSPFYLAALPADRAPELREGCRRMLPPGSFEITAVAWTAVGRA